MFFANLLIYRLTQGMPFAAEALEAALATKKARAPATQELATYGFIAPFGKGEDAPLVHVSGGYLLFAARKEERIMPGQVVRNRVAAKVTEIEAEQMRKVYKKERDQIKDEIIQAMLPHAFTRTAATFAAILPKEGLILVNCSSPRRAEDLLSTLREVVGSLPVRPVCTKIAPMATLTEWVKQENADSGFYVLDQALLKDTHEDGGQITAKRQDLTSDEIQLHLSTGKQVTKLSLAWQDKLSFILDEKMIITRLRFEDVLTEQAEADGGEDALGVMDAQFFLNCATLAEFIPELLTALGGEEIPQGLAEETEFEQRILANPVRREARPEHQVDIEESIDATYGENDELYEEAKAFVIESRRASISAVQRKLKIGYNRAARLIEAMENHGIVTPMNTNGSREVIAVAAA